MGTSKKPTLDNARYDWEGIYFLDPDDQDYKEILKHARRENRKDLWAPAMPCKRAPNNITKVFCKSLSIASVKAPKTVSGCKVESHESHKATSWPKNHEDRIARIYFNDPITIWCTNLFRCTKRMNIRDAKAAVDKEWKKSPRQSQRGNWTRWRAKKRSFQKREETKRKSTLLHWWTFATSRMTELEPQLQKYKERVCALVRHCKSRRWSLRSFYWTGIGPAFQMSAAKVMDIISRLPGCQRTSSLTQYLLIPR